MDERQTAAKAESVGGTSPAHKDPPATQAVEGPTTEELLVHQEQMQALLEQAQEAATKATQASNKAWSWAMRAEQSAKLCTDHARNLSHEVLDVLTHPELKARARRVLARLGVELAAEQGPTLVRGRRPRRVARGA